MMNLQTKLVRLVSMSPEHWDVPMRVELRPYLEFNRSIACQLNELVERYAGHTPKIENQPFNDRNRLK
jgi:hypothetical protein